MTTLRRREGAGRPRLWKPCPFRLLTYDPGGTTGWSSAIWNPERHGNVHPQESYDPPKLRDIQWDCGQIGPQEHHEELFEHVSLFNPQVIICESFEFRQHINQSHTKTKVELISKEYIGVIKLWSIQNPTLLFFQTASAAKTLVSDDKIKCLGLWVPSKPHAMDARRHLLRYMVATMAMRYPITDRWLAA